MRPAWILAAALLCVMAGCGQKRQSETPELKFEMQADTASLSTGAPLLNRVEAYRVSGGALRMRGDVTLPDGVRLQISVYPHGEEQLLGRVQVVTENRRFDSPPLVGPGGPLPRGAYRIEYLALFNPAWQTEDVLRRTDNGRGIRGPGVTRDRVGGAAFYLIEERTL